MKQLVIFANKSIYIKRLTELLSYEYRILLICRDKEGLSEDEFDDSVVFKYLKSNLIIYKIAYVFYSLLFFKADVFYLHYMAKDCIIPGIFRLMFRYRYIIGIVGSDIKILSKKKLTRLYQKVGMILSSDILTVTEDFNHDIELFSPKFLEKTRVISWGIEYDFFSKYNKNEILKLKHYFKIPESKKIILSYRNLLPLYNIETLIEAFKIIQSEGIDFYGVVLSGYSSNDYIKQIEQLIKDNDLQDKVIIIKELVSRDVIRVLLNMSHITINIPLSDGLPASLLEAMSSRSIPVCSNLDTYKSYFSNNVNGGVLLNNKSKEELSRLIMKYLNISISERKKIIRKNKLYIKENQNWNEQKLILSNFFKELI